MKSMLKIHWNLKNPIKLDVVNEPVANNTNGTTDEDITRHLFVNDFKTTSIKDLNQKKQLQMGWDDTYSSTSSKDRSISSSSSGRFKSQTVKCRPTQWKRSTFLRDEDREELKKKESANDEDQMFVPSYGSVSSICINSNTTCSKAIKILLEKFHVKKSYENEN